MTTLTAQQIACVYAWLAQLFSRELDDEQLTQRHRRCADGFRC
ncbi:chaperone protein TorD [Shigella flexneri]|nr:chaperone protein TorD [Shigella flexneri]